MQRITSRISYKELVASGKLKGRRLQVLKDVFENPGTTQGETGLRIRTANPQIKDHSITPRFAELVDRGLLIELPPRPCAVSGKLGITYQFSGEIVMDPPKRQSKSRLLEEQVAALTDEVNRLRKKLAAFEPKDKQAEFAFRLQNGQLI